MIETNTHTQTSRVLTEIVCCCCAALLDSEREQHEANQSTVTQHTVTQSHSHTVTSVSCQSRVTHTLLTDKIRAQRSASNRRSLGTTHENRE